MGAFLSAFVPPLFITFVALATYFISPRAIETRFSICNSGFISLVLFHATLKSQTPIAGVLTMADDFMLGCYAVTGHFDPEPTLSTP